MEEIEKEQFSSDEEKRLYSLRHSAAHIMAQAVMRLYPEASLAIGPPIKDGFYYDIDINTTLNEESLVAIEKEMKKIVKENQKFEHEEWETPKALEFFAKANQKFKIELIETLGVDSVHIYKNVAKDGTEFVDLCRGPHVMRTKQCKHFKLLKVSGAYWRADASREQLQRIYGTVWKTKDDLVQYMFQIEEAKKRDHRRLGRELELFMFHEYAPGAPFWLPKGEHIYNLLSTRMRSVLVGEGYVSVKTPLIFDKKLWETSGHWEHYSDDMFRIQEGDTEVEVTGADDGDSCCRTFGLKPMNCPAHMLIFGSKKRSYRELPLRIHDQGVLHRNELSGALSGLTRVRQFAQDDGHIFCMEEQIESEVFKLIELVERIYTAFGMGYSIKLSTRPKKFLGDIEVWDQAEESLKNALVASGQKFTINEGDGAFYGPKIDFEVLDALGRAFQCATVQLDFQLPIRFDLKYVGSDNLEHRPVVVHRAVLGSFERFVGILIEHYAGKFPVWLAPEQVRILTVSEKSDAHGKSVLERLKALGVEAVWDDSSNKIGYKIREARNQRIPYLLVIGAKELESDSVSVRSRDEGELGAMSVSDFLTRIEKEIVPAL